MKNAETLSSEGTNNHEILTKKKGIFNVSGGRDTMNIYPQSSNEEILLMAYLLQNNAFVDVQYKTQRPLPQEDQRGVKMGGKRQRRLQ